MIVEDNWSDCNVKAVEANPSTCPRIEEPCTRTLEARITALEGA
jgi:hypothetical protein